MKITKGYQNEKCNIEGLDDQKKQAYTEARRKLKYAHGIFKRLSEKHANFKIK